MSKKSKAAERAERAAAFRREQERRQKRRNALVGGAVALVLVVVVAAAYVVIRASDDSDEVASPTAGGSDYGLAIGDADAPDQVVIYEDFLCPFCGDLEEATRDDLARLADEGQVYVDYRPFNLLGTDYSVAAANAFAVVLEESGADVAKEFHDTLFVEQPAESGPYPDDEWLVEKAVEAGASEDDVRPGIEDLSEESWVEGATEAAEEAGVQGTPTIVLNGEVYQDGRSIEEIASNLIATLE